MPGQKSVAEAEAENKWAKNQRSSQQQAAIKGMRLGGRDYSYLIQDGQINVLKNTRGGVEVGLNIVHAL